jgi:hypothetical protein
MRLPEKGRDSAASDAEQSVLRSPVCLGTIAQYGHCSRISAQSERTFSAVQTAWRSAQSRANLSPREFPANREKYREFAQFYRLKLHSFPLSYTFGRRSTSASVNRSRELTGRYQGRIRELSSLIRELLRGRLSGERGEMTEQIASGRFKRLPVRDYLLKQGRFAHFIDDDIDYFQSKIDDMWNKWLVPWIIPLQKDIETE